MYDRIKERPSPHLLYGQQLASEGVVDSQMLTKFEADTTVALEAAYQEVHGSSCLFPQPSCFKEMEGFSSRYSHDPVDTAVNKETLSDLAIKLNTLPSDFTAHNKVKMLLRRRMQSVEKGEGLDWGNAEALAFASLLADGVPIRLTGEDTRRGTFSQRHAVSTIRLRS